MGEFFPSIFHRLSFRIMSQEYTLLSHSFHHFSIDSKMSQPFPKYPRHLSLRRFPSHFPSHFPTKTISQSIPRFPSHYQAKSFPYHDQVQNVPLTSQPKLFPSRFQDFPVSSQKNMSVSSKMSTCTMLYTE